MLSLEFNSCPLNTLSCIQNSVFYTCNTANIHKTGFSLHIRPQATRFKSALAIWRLLAIEHPPLHILSLHSSDDGDKHTTTLYVGWR